LQLQEPELVLFQEFLVLLLRLELIVKIKLVQIADDVTSRVRSQNSGVRSQNSAVRRCEKRAWEPVGGPSSSPRAATTAAPATTDN
jgi:hypothetical protein